MVPTQYLKGHPLLLDYFSYGIVLPSLLTVKPKKHLYQHSARSNTGAGQCYFWQPYDRKCTSAHNFKPNQLPESDSHHIHCAGQREPLEEGRRKYLSLRNKQQEQINTLDWYYWVHCNLKLEFNISYLTNGLVSKSLSRQAVSFFLLLRFSSISSFEKSISIYM